MSVSGDGDQDDSNTTRTKSQPPNLPKQRLKAQKSAKGEMNSVELHLKEAPCIIEVGAGPIPDICHGRHGHTRVNFFGRCKFLQI